MASVPHGGVLVDQTVPMEVAAEELKRAATLPHLPADRDTLWDAEKIAIGAFSPLTGFMTGEQVKAVVDDMRLPSGEVWSMPILCPVPDAFVGQVRGAKEVALVDERDEVVAILQVQDVFHPDKRWLVKGVFGTEDEKHPGVARVLNQPEWFVGGEIRLLQPPENPYRRWEQTPRQTRAHFERMGWRTVVGFQTRNAPHRAHEYLQRCALEFCDGLLIQPIMGTKKGDDFPTEAIMAAYEALVREFYPADRVLLSGITTWMRYGGPREAVFHAIFRKNYGCTHFIVGRDHAGVGNYYDPYAAHRIFDELPDLGITVLKVTAAFYCERCGCLATEKTCGHLESRRNISMTALRTMLRNGEMPPRELIRPEIAAILREFVVR